MISARFSRAALDELRATVADARARDDGQPLAEAAWVLSGARPGARLSFTRRAFRALAQAPARRAERKNDD